MASLEITMDDIHRARDQISGVVRPTPTRLALSPQLRARNVYLKMENLQLTGSFKLRGALNKISSLTDVEKKKGVIAASAGNHAQGVAYSAKKHGVACHIVMPKMAPLVKVERTREYGSEVTLHGRYFDEAYEKAKELAKEQGQIFVHPYQDAKVIAGQGTIGLEVFEALADVDNVVVPIGGGGLIGGVAFALKHLKPEVKVFGVTSDQAPGMRQLKHGEDLTTAGVISTIADGIAVKKPSPVMFKNFIDPYVDDIVSVSDEEIAQAIVLAMESEKTIVEGSGAAGLAAILNGKLPLRGTTCVLLCGGNIDLNMVSSVIDTGLRRQGRLTRLTTIVSDLPGGLAKLTSEFAANRANILDVIHDRVSPELGLRETRIDFLLETMSFEHIAEIKRALKNIGIHVVEES